PTARSTISRSRPATSTTATAPQANPSRCPLPIRSTSSTGCPIATGRNTDGSRYSSCARPRGSAPPAAREQPSHGRGHPRRDGAGRYPMVERKPARDVDRRPRPDAGRAHRRRGEPGAAVDRTAARARLPQADRRRRDPPAGPAAARPTEELGTVPRKEGQSLISRVKKKRDCPPFSSWRRLELALELEVGFGDAKRRRRLPGLAQEQQQPGHHQPERENERGGDVELEVDCREVLDEQQHD